jgi:tRNA dimethylallyltransferase
MTIHPSTVICLMGPTASGKSNLAMALAAQLPIDIISVDSAMVYQGMDIGTAKPTLVEQQRHPHQLIDLCDPKTPYSAGKFYQDAIAAIEHSHQQRRLPLLVGGTMLYFHVLQRGFSDLPTADPVWRDKLQQQAQEIGWPAMHARLQQIDPTAAAQIKANDAQRIQRALEVYYVTQQSLSDLQTSRRLTVLPYRFINIIVAPKERAQLHQRITQRFHHMLDAGFIAEVKGLYDRGDLSADLSALRTVGYRQIWAYLAGEYDEAMMIEKALTATRQLAKRQLTWLRRWTDAVWFDSEDADLLNHVLTYLNEKNCH